MTWADFRALVAVATLALLVVDAWRFLRAATRALDAYAAWRRER